MDSAMRVSDENNAQKLSTVADSVYSVQLTHYSDKLVALAGMAEGHTVHIGAKQINVCSRDYMHAMARAVCMVVLVMFTIKRPKSSGPISRSVRVCRSHPSPQTVSLETTLRGRVMVSQSQSASPACSKFTEVPAQC
jgi:hypothetical protein